MAQYDNRYGRWIDDDDDEEGHMQTEVGANNLERCLVVVVVGEKPKRV